MQTSYINDIQFRYVEYLKSTKRRKQKNVLTIVLRGLEKEGGKISAGLLGVTTSGVAKSLVEKHMICESQRLAFSCWQNRRILLLDHDKYVRVS